MLPWFSLKHVKPGSAAEQMRADPEWKNTVQGGAGSTGD
jgi:hypothetical protein